MEKRKDFDIKEWKKWESNKKVTTEIFHSCQIRSPSVRNLYAHSNGELAYQTAIRNFLV